jgi:hypothetical protein
MMTSHPADGLQELERLKASGADVLLRVPAEVDLMTLMEPSSVPKALALGTRQALEDLDALTDFWRSDR